jgi:TRAP-type C4-dicarboxylate transport system substrate-binding protein
MASIAPIGSAWARVLQQFSEDVEQRTRGQVRVKWYMGGEAGDELEALERVRRGELSGLAASVGCQRVAPSLRVIEVASLAETDDEAAEVLRRLRPLVDEEFEKSPFMLLSLTSGLGHRVLFSREPVRSMEELRAGRYWYYDLDQVVGAQLSLMGVHAVPLPIARAGPAFDQGHIDGFFSVPYAAMAFRYGVKAGYFTDLRSMFLPGCLIASRRAMAELTDDEQRMVREAADVRLGTHFARVGNQQDEELLRRVFPQQGLRAVPMSAAFRREYMNAARAAGIRLSPLLVPLTLVRDVVDILNEMRTTHTRADRTPLQRASAGARRSVGM